MRKNIFNTSILFLLLIIIFGCGNETNSNSEQEELEHKFTNELINETSPYLLDHAHNPVNWRAWSPEAFEVAKKNDQLVVISIGYSSCHWCHVMEEETFANEDVAKIMNENFVNIKVDREERPDIDEVYMTAINLIKGNGGWPLNVIALPNGKPIYTGTYHTTEQWSEVLSKISTSYKENPEKANEYANMVAEGIKETNLITLENNSQKLERNTLQDYVDEWSRNWDKEYGGDIGNQKFMLPSYYNFLMDYALVAKDQKSLKHFKNSMLKMSNGGVYDQIGGGFFRYSVDEKWAIPHYEKMLYDNAQLLSLFSKAYRAFKDPEYKDTAEGITSFLKTTMKSPDGGFYSAISADSNGEEGQYYTWSRKELRDILGSEFENFSKYYSLHIENEEEDKNVIFQEVSDSLFLEKNSINQAQLNTKKQEWQKALIQKRKNRVQPEIDDKILISWNALLISGFVEAYKAFGDKEYLEMAESTFQFIRKKGYADGNLIHSYKEGGKTVDGFLDDYSYLASASIELYSVTQETKYLEFAENLVEHVNKHFTSENSELYRYSMNDELISPILKIDDGVLPSPNSIMAENLFILGHIFYNESYLKKSEDMVASVQMAVKESPAAYAKWNELYLKHAYNFLEIAIVGDDADILYSNFVKDYYPNSITVASTNDSKVPLFEERYVTGYSYIYVCENRSCKRPVTTVQEAKRLIREIR